MSNQELQPRLSEKLQAAAASYQDAHVIHHCAACTKPCCALDALVLDLNWKQVKVFWQLEEARAAFDGRLASGTGPEEIRAANGRYYVHRKPCPAYDLTQRNCRVYNQPIKPAGCSDFPVYEDGGCLIADLRCEAVNIEALTDWIARALGPEYRIIQSADRDFPFLVSLSLRKSGAKRAPTRGRR